MIHALVVFELHELVCGDGEVPPQDVEVEVVVLRQFAPQSGLATVSDQIIPSVLDVHNELPRQAPRVVGERIHCQTIHSYFPLFPVWSGDVALLLWRA